MNLFLSAIKAEFALALTVFIMEEDFTIGADWRYICSWWHNCKNAGENFVRPAGSSGHVESLISHQSSANMSYLLETLWSILKYF